MNITDTLQRIIPSNIRAEQMLLGSILNRPNLFEQVNEFLKPQHFYELFHQKIYHFIEVLIEKNITPSLIVVSSMLDKEKGFKEIGGEGYLVNLSTMALVVINPYDYGKVIFDMAMKRSLIEICELAVNEVYDSTPENSGIDELEKIENKLYSLASNGINEKNFISLKNHIFSSMESINNAMQNSDKVSGISTGLIDLDQIISGFHNSDLVIMAGRPGMGKTAFALNFAYSACKTMLKKHGENKTPKPVVGFFSLEMSSEQLANRMLSMASKIDSINLRNGVIKEEEYNRLKIASEELAEMPIFIDDTAGLTINAIRTRARKLKRKYNLSIIFIDYLQLIRTNNKSENRVLEVSEITQGLKNLAKELNIPIIALAQLSRAVEQREDKRPMLSDLRESGSIEQDADIVMLLYREEYYLLRKNLVEGDRKFVEWQDRLSKSRNIAEIQIAKHRNGAIGNVLLHYDDKFSTISNLSKQQTNN